MPESVLLGVSYLESRWDANAGAPSTSGGYGPMHLTDAALRAALPGRGHHDDGAEDARGDDSRAARLPGDRRPPRPRDPPAVAADHGRGRRADRRRRARRCAPTPAANIRGGAALLAAYQEDARRAARRRHRPGGLVRRGGPLLRRGQRATPRRPFADEVFATIRAGAGAPPTTASGSRLPPAAGLARSATWLDRLGLRRLARPGRHGVPGTVSCEWIPAPYEEFGDGDYGNHDLADRPSAPEDRVHRRPRHRGRPGRRP